VVIVTNGCFRNVQLAAGPQKLEIPFNNHFTLFRRLLSTCDECLLVSPFLCKDFGWLVEGLNLNSLRVELITTCAPRGDDQLEKPFALRNFGHAFQVATGTWPRIGLDQKLHCKVYVFSVDDKPFAGVITSANLTQNGLVENHETGLLFTEEKELVQVSESVRSALDYVSLSEYQIGMLCTAAEVFARGEKPSTDREIGLTNILNRYCTPSAGNRSIRLRKDARYYIKVSGVTDRPILPKDRKPFDEPHCQLSFAKSPGRVKLGDCLLEVAVGGMCFLSYYSCASTTYERTDEEKRQDPDNQRWPFYIYANNLSLHYGSAWFERPIYYDDVVKQFKEKYPHLSVTSAGKDHFLGAMQMGHSYIPVSKEFGEYVRQRIDEFRAEQSK
jgi:hypothetical protein